MPSVVQKLLFPMAAYGPYARARVAWGPLCVRRVLWVLRNPRYAGAYFNGRYRCRKMPEGKARWVLLPPDQWNTLIRDAHAGYISWEEQQSIQEQLRRTAQAFGADRHKSPPREGPAQLQGRGAIPRFSLPFRIEMLIKRRSRSVGNGRAASL